MKKIKEWIKTHKVQPIIAGGASVALVIAIIFAICLIGINKNDKQGEKSASVDITTSKEPLESSETKKEETKKTTEESIEATTDTEEESTTNPAESSSQTSQTTTNQSTSQATTQPTQPQTTVPQTTAPKPPTSPAVSTPKRGENGVILEELDLILKISGEVPVPKTKEIMEQYMKSTGSPEDSKLIILYNSPDVQQQNIFNNELKFLSTTIAQLKAIYGEPIIPELTSPSGDKYFVYQYGNYANGEDTQTIYINFGFKKEKNFTLSGISIGNKKDLALEDYIN